MRSFLITLILFFATCSLIVLNNRYITATAEQITSLVDDKHFLEDPEDSITELEKHWEANHPIVGLSVGYKELDRMSDLIIDLRTYHNAENTAEVTRVRVMIAEAANEISRLEQFSIENLF